jgi:hypothetical protein
MKNSAVVIKNEPCQELLEATMIDYVTWNSKILRVPQYSQFGTSFSLGMCSSDNHSGLPFLSYLITCSG